MPMPRRKRRRRWTPAEAHSVLKALIASGVSPRSFAEREGLDVARLYRSACVASAAGAK
jgi:hypothetical protein